MADPMTPERLAEIRRAWDGVDATSHRLTVTNTRTPGQLLHALSRASQDVPALLAEVERLRELLRAEEALTDYVGATILTLTPHFTPVASWDDPGMPAAAIVLDGYRRQITWTPDSGWRYTRLYPGTAAQRGPAYYLDAGPVPSPQVLVDGLRRWRAGEITWTDRPPSYPPVNVLEALRAAVPDAARLRSCPDCGRWRDVDPGEHARCETCDTDLPQRAALDGTGNGS